MYRLLRHVCPRCNNPFKVETESPDTPAAASACQVRCPRCFTTATVRVDAGEPQPQPTPWAVKATPVVDTADGR